MLVLRRLMLVLILAVMVVVIMAAYAGPAFAVQGGEKPRTYGDCTSFYASNSESPLLPEPIVETVQDWTDLTAPADSEGEGTEDEIRVDCRGFPPPPPPR